MLKITQICNRSQGSVADMVLAATGGFVKAGHAVTNVFFSGPVDCQLAARFPCKYVSYAGVLEKHGKQAVVRQLRSMLRRNGCDVVIAHRYHPAKIAARASRGLSIKRRIAVFHGLGNLKRWRRKLFVWLFLRDWHFAGVSEAVVRDIRDSGSAFRIRKPVRHVSNGLDIKALEAAHLGSEEARKRLGLPSGDFIFGNIGRLSDSKNQKVLITAYAMIADKLPPSRLVIIGEGRKEAELRSLVAAHGLQDRVLMTGFVPHAQRYLKAFDLFVFPSRSEAFGLALLEAMVARVPVIVSRVGGICELVGNYPFTISPDDAPALASQMAAMVTKPAPERNRIGSGLYARAATGYDISRLEEAYLEIIAVPS